MRADELPGCFVVESGLRQAWPFIGFCDNRPAESLEFRLYIDAPWSLFDRQPHHATNARAWLASAEELGGLTVSTANVTSDGSLQIGFLSQGSLIVSGQAGAATVGEPWWFAGPLRANK